MKLGYYISLLFLGIFIQVRVNAQISPGDLSQKHSGLEGMSNCTKCHAIGNAVTNQNCLACHKEIQSLLNRKGGYHSDATVISKRCVECHSDHHGKKFQMTRFDQKTFNHNLAGYKLENSHAPVDCKKCHKTDYISDNEIKKRANTFLGLQQECNSCHKDYHQGTLDKKCNSCHDTKKFKPAPGFDHNKAKFRLKGAHTKTTCIECHKKTTKNGADFQTFTGLKFSSCVDCHKDVHNGKFGLNCANCHNDESFKKLNQNISNFNHNKTDYPLTGKHVKVECRLCHKNNNYLTPINTTQCKNCHTDFHKGDFIKNNINPDCKECHTLEKAFTFTTYGIENHQTTSFKLEGSHIATPCASCHKSESRWKFKSVGQQCVDCHKDIHNGQISEKYYPKSDCAKCHNMEVWTTVLFDHNTTNWKLEGNHAKATCRACHFTKITPQEPISKQKFSSLGVKCAQCHDNIHGNQFEVNGETDCIRCHSSKITWDVSSYDHSKTRFQLDGKHVNVACAKCHKETKIENQKERRVYKLSKIRCIDCHL